MNETETRGGDLLEAIHSSKGMEHVNRSYHRSFLLNIFRMNAQELVEITSRVNDPGEGLRLMAQANREAGVQTHREVTRRVHNFVAAALTLVDHTRAFMCEHYKGTSLIARYQASIDSDFASEPLVRFVKDMRNYMLHRGLPPSEMFLHFTSDPNLPDGGGILTSGIRIRADLLSVWSGWSVPAKKFIESSGEFIDIHSFAEAYTDKIVSFHDWLQHELDQFHRADLDELHALKTSLNQSGTLGSPPVQANNTGAEALEKLADEVEELFSFSYERAAALDGAAEELFKKVREIDLPSGGNDGFVSDRPSVPISQEELIGTPLLWSNDTAGRRVFVFIHMGGRAFGLDAEAFVGVQSLIESVLKVNWARETLSWSFIETVVITWLQSKFTADEPGCLSHALTGAAREAVRPLELWAPIANLESQVEFSMGPTVVTPMTKAKFDRLQAKYKSMTPPSQLDGVNALFNDLRSRIQGLAVVIFKADGEEKKVEEDGGSVARIVVGLLRFFSPAAMNFPMVCGNALLGAEIVPSSNLLVLGESTFSYRQVSLSPNAPWWRLSEAALRENQPRLDAVGSLVRPEGLSSFALAVRSSLLLFGTGTTFSNPTERLTYSLSSLEALLLRHSAEPAQFGVAERMGLLLAQDRSGREEVARNVREAYRLRGRQDISPLNPHETASVATFLRNAYNVIGIALDNVERFRAVAEFTVSIDQRKTQGNQAAG